MPAPKKYDRAELVPIICKRLATGKEPLSVILADLGLQRRTVDYWRKEDAEIAAQFDEARDTGYDNIAADCLEIADNMQQGIEIVEKNGHKEIHHGDMLGHRKLRIETRMKLLAKWDPRRYGERMTLAGDPKNPLHVVKKKLELTEDELLEIAAQGGSADG